MRAPTDCTATASNPNAFDQQPRAQPAPIPTPAHEPNQTGGTSQRRHDDGLPRRSITRRRQSAGPYAGHEGACTTLLALSVVAATERVSFVQLALLIVPRRHPPDHTDGPHADHRQEHQRRAQRLHRNRRNGQFQHQLITPPTPRVPGVSYQLRLGLSASQAG